MTLKTVLVHAAAVSSLVAGLTSPAYAIDQIFAPPSREQWHILAVQAARCSGSYAAIAEALQDGKPDEAAKLTELHQAYQLIADRVRLENAFDANEIRQEFEDSVLITNDALANTTEDFLKEMTSMCTGLFEIAQGMGLN